ncbi:MAG: hypothetical protein Q4F17_10295 [Eubacteriales bacterium]|nr:hypothetical protein [Eubacteriales bacterium]
MNKNYDDIINLPHHVSSARPHMSAIDRAAQFSPFAALTGYDAAVKETARLTGERIELDEYEKDALNDKLQLIVDTLGQGYQIAVTYFLPDKRKAGGEYITVTGEVKKIDEYEHLIILRNGQKIPVEEVIDLDGKLFKSLQ